LRTKSHKVCFVFIPFSVQALPEVPAVEIGQLVHPVLALVISSSGII
jgi:hypothetical protein